MALPMMLLRTPCRRLLASLPHVASVRSSSDASFALTYNAYGDPCEVLQYTETTGTILNQKLSGDQVLVKFLASPVNPADINTVQGRYAVMPPLPAVGGNEGIGEILQIGKDVKTLRIGDQVIAAQGGFGTWRTHAVGRQSDFVAVDGNGIDVTALAQLSVNPCTAYRMLKDFVHLQKGDCIIQNGANSAVGLNVIQLAKEWGIRTINIIRPRLIPDDTAKLAGFMKELGADHVWTPKKMNDKTMTEELFKQFPQPKLGLNCVGGRLVHDMAKHLVNGSTVVTYGGMSLKPLDVATSVLIFRDIRFVGYWMTRWNSLNSNSPERSEMLKYLCDLMRRGKLRPPKTVEMKLSDYKKAVIKSTDGYNDAKYVFVM